MTDNVRPSDDSRESPRQLPFRVTAAVFGKKKKKKGKGAQQEADDPATVAQWLQECVALQRKIFPKCESLDIVGEVKKANSVLFVAVAKQLLCQVESDDDRGGGGAGGGSFAFSYEKDAAAANARSWETSEGKDGADVDVEDDEESCIGFLLITRTGSSAYISKLCVSDKFRRRGVGIALMNLTIAHLKRARCQTLRLHVSAFRVLGFNCAQRRQRRHHGSSCFYGVAQFIV